MRRVLLAVVAALVAATGCQVRSAVTVDVNDDGSGRVEVAVGLDQEALAQLPDLDGNGVGDGLDLTQMIRVDDLRATGWEVGPADPGDDGLTWIKASKPFGTPEEGVAVLGELTGPDGPLREWKIERSHSFGQTRYDVSGRADLTAGIEAFGDEGLAAALDGEPLGEDAAMIEQRFGRPINELVKLDVNVNLPGQGTTSSWSPHLGGPPVQMTASSTVYNAPVLGLAALAALCLVGLAGLLVVRLIRR